MKDTQSQTESLLDIVKGIASKSIMLPEFQRDFRWELQQTYDLFDSLIREIFIGTLIYGKPSFGMTLREIDQRPRKGKGSNSLLKTVHYSTDQISTQAQTHNLRIVLDGQQRLTSIYRAMTGLDSVYLILRQGLDPAAINQLSLEELVEEVTGEESRTAISVKLSHAYRAEHEILEDDDLNQLFAVTNFAQTELRTTDETDRKAAEKIYRRAIGKIRDLFKQQKMVAFYMLDMSLDKFCLFFERSNSRGIQLDFTDILAAKLYHGFNLRLKIEEFESQTPSFRLNREIIVRAIAFIVATEGKGQIKIDRKFILENLDAEDFNNHWDEVCRLYVDSLRYLASQHYILSQEWMPSENMLIPLMLLLREIQGFDRMTQDQKDFLEYWYWASVFSNRYSTASNEAIIADCTALSQVARGERISNRGYFARLRPLVTEADDLFNYNKRSSSIYRGILNLLAYSAKGLSDWKNNQKIDVSMRLEDHHIYPKAYIASGPLLQEIDREEALQFVDCVVNRTLIPKILNINIGKKSPSTYLKEIQLTNHHLQTCLKTHLIPDDMISDPEWDSLFKLFLEERATMIYSLIESHTAGKHLEMSTRHGTQTEVSDTPISTGKLRLKDMLTSHKIEIGERVFTRKKPTDFATIVDGDTVEFRGETMLINSWGQMMTGWSSISIYDSVLLERTGKPLKSLREIE